MREQLLQYRVRFVLDFLATFVKCATYDEDGEVLVRFLLDGDGDGLHGELVLQVDLPPPLPARLGRPAAGVRVAVGRQIGVVVP